MSHENYTQLQKKKRFGFLDAPLSGGQLGAINGVLSVMVGGDEKDFEYGQTNH